MTIRSFPSFCRAVMLAAGIVGATSAAQAQPAPAPMPDPQPAPLPAQPPSPAAPDAGAEAPGTTPPEAPAAVPSAPATTSAAAAPAPAPSPALADDPISPLVPTWEPAQMASRPIRPEVTFRPGKGLIVGSADGAFEIAMKIRGQILATFEADHAPGGPNRSGAQIRRARLAFQGHMFGKHNKYKFELATSPRDASTRRDGAVGTAPLLDWTMTFDYLKAATVVAGQYKVPFSRQRVVSSGSLQMVDRSIVQSEFNLDRNVGVDVRSTSLLRNRLHYFVGLYAGEGRNAFELREQNHVYLARVEVLPFGEFQDYVEADFERTGPRLSIGASYAYVKDSLRDQGPLGSPPADEGQTSFHTAEADLLLKVHGLSVTGELFWRDGEREPGDAVDDLGAPIPVEAARNGIGFFGQAGYLLPRSSLELSARYGKIVPASSDTSLAERQELGAGVSYYFAQHAFKLQADYFHLWDEAGIGDGSDVVRLQLEAGL